MPDKEKDLNNTPVAETTDTPADEAAENIAEPEGPAEARDQLAEMEAKMTELSDKHLRLMAEYDNYRKRTTREREALYKDVQAATVMAFLSVADNFARAMEAPTSDPDFKKGMEMIQNSLSETLSQFGVERFGAAGEPFDPTLHDAVAHLPQEGIEAGQIAQVYSPGYRMGERILRPATVVVAD